MAVKMIVQTARQGYILKFGDEYSYKVILPDNYPLWKEIRDIGQLNIITDGLKIVSSNPFLQGKTAEEIKAVDVTMLAGLHNFKRYSRGYKIYSRWFVEENFVDTETVPAVERIYSLIWNNGILKGELCIMNWYNNDNSLAFSKETSEYYSAKDAAKILKDIRETRILYLQNPEPEFISPEVKQYIDLLFEHYKSTVSDYILNGGKSFEDAIVNESDATILQILGAVLADGKTVKESILYQIQGGY